jgi:hypothetical protein
MLLLMYQQIFQNKVVVSTILAGFVLTGFVLTGFVLTTGREVSGLEAGSGFSRQAAKATLKTGWH